MSGALALLEALAVHRSGTIIGAALAAALMVVLAALIYAAVAWHHEERRPGYVELRPKPGKPGEPSASIAEWRANAHASLARSRERRGHFG